MFWRTQSAEIRIQQMLLLLMYKEPAHFLMLCSTALPLFLMTALEILKSYNWLFIIYGLKKAEIKWSMGFYVKSFILTLVSSWDHRKIMHLEEAVRPNKFMLMLWYLTRISVYFGVYNEIPIYLHLRS